MDLLAAVIAMMASCQIYMTRVLRDAEGDTADSTDSVRQSIEWMVRQGPDLLLCAFSQNTQNRKRARDHIQKNWLGLPLSYRVWQSELYGNTTDVEEARPQHDFRAIWLWNRALYRHSRQDEWDAAGYPSLWDCVVKALRQETTYDLNDRPEMIPLATWLRAFKIR